MAGRRPGPEKEFQAQLVAALHQYGYVVSHTYKLRCQDGSWRTGNTLKGQPDLIALRPPRLLAIEVKHESPLAVEQQAVLSYYAGIPNARAWVLRTSDDWDRIVSWLREPQDAPRAHGFDRLTTLDAYRIVATATQRTGPR